MARKEGKRRKEWHPKEGYFSWDTPEEEILGPDYKIRRARFYKSLVNFTKDPDSPEVIDETLRLAQETHLDSYPEIIKKMIMNLSMILITSIY
jgi:hypothetical protein